MTKKLLRNYIILLITTFAIFVSGVTWVLANSALTISKNNARNYLNIVQEDFINSGQNTSLTIQHFEQQISYLRITFIDEFGNVLLDSHSDTIENHLDRPEIQNPGSVYKRYSTTLDTQMLYISEHIESSNLYLRIAIPLASIASNSTYYIIIIIGFALVLMILSYLIFQRFIDNSSQALQKISYSLSRVVAGDYHEVDSSSGYNEIDDIITHINQVNQQILNTVTHLADEKDKINYILNNIQQGIAAINREQKVLLANDYIKKVFQIEKLEIGQSFLLLIRKIELQMAIIDCLKNNAKRDLDLIINDVYYHISIAPLVASSTNTGGVLVLMNNIHEIMKTDKMKKEFFSNASHELKSPLTSIIAASELIANQIVSEEKEVIDLSSRINEEALRMKTLVLQMLNISRLESLKNIDNPTDIDLSNLMTVILDSFALQIKEKQMKVHLEISHNSLHANYEDIYQMLSNLIENAIRYGKQGGNIWLNIFQQDGIHIIVKDDGIGIDKIHHERVFERFYRVDRGRNRDSGSTGLGLSIVKHVALIYNAKISLDSEIDKGTEIKVVFPNKK